MIGTGILKSDSEIAEMFEVKDGTHHLEIDILLLHRGKKIILVLQVATSTSIISVFLNLFLKFWCPSCSKFPESFKTHPTFVFW